MKVSVVFRVNFPRVALLQSAPQQGGGQFRLQHGQLGRGFILDCALTRGQLAKRDNWFEILLILLWFYVELLFNQNIFRIREMALIESPKRRDFPRFPHYKSALIYNGESWESTTFFFR